MNTVAGLFVTDDIQVALAGGYIGEAPCVPKPLDSALHEARTGRPLPTWWAIYYGTPDDATRERFGYSEGWTPRVS